MQIRKFRAANIHDALSQVLAELGPEASVLQTRDVRVGGMFGFGRREEIEVTASLEVNVPSRVPQLLPVSIEEPIYTAPPQAIDDVGIDLARLALPAGDDASQDEPESIVAPPEQSALVLPRRPASEAAFQLFAELIEAGLPDELARELLERAECKGRDDYASLRGATRELIQRMIRTTGPIPTSGGQQRLVALVGPTGVGKTTTIAKLAANFRLREKRRVGLITVDTYRIAAVEQLRTYADIIDLPMEVVSSPRQTKGAIAKLGDVDLILMDTAGRSPRDEVKIQELKLILAEAEADEVHLVLSSVSSAANLSRTVERFRPVGLSSLLFTKLDESAMLGHLLAVIDDCRLPLSYVTHGQNVPDDIEAAAAEKLATEMLV